VTRLFGSAGGESDFRRPISMVFVSNDLANHYGKRPSVGSLRDDIHRYYLGREPKMHSKAG